MTAVKYLLAPKQNRNEGENMYYFNHKGMYTNKEQYDSVRMFCRLEKVDEIYFRSSIPAKSREKHRRSRPAKRLPGIPTIINKIIVSFNHRQSNLKRDVI